MDKATDFITARDGSRTHTSQIQGGAFLSIGAVASLNSCNECLGQVVEALSRRSQGTLVSKSWPLDQ